MIRMVKNVAGTLAIASLVVAQPALATRSSESLPTPGAKVTSLQVQRAGSKVGAAEDIHGSSAFIIASISLVAIVALLLAATNGHHDGDNVSPG